MARTSKEEGCCGEKRASQHGARGVQTEADARPSR